MPLAGHSALFSRPRPRGLARIVAAVQLATGSAVLADDGGTARHASNGTGPVEVSATPAVSTDMCIESHTQSQLLRQREQLLESRLLLRSCGSAGCPSAIRRDCARWLEEIDQQIPSVAFRASLAGEESVGVQVLVDGKLVFERLEGKALELDPGAYRVKFVPPAPFEPIDQELVMSQGEQFRIVTVEFERPANEREPLADDTAPAEPRRPTPTATYIFAGIGAAAAVSGAAWGLSTWAVKGELEASCAPECPGRTVDVVRQRALFADISWGISAASFITAAAFYWLRPEAHENETAIDVSLRDGGVIGAVEIPLH